MDASELGENGTATRSGRRPWRLGLVLLLGAVALGIPAVRRTVNGSSDLRGFHRIWRANLEHPTQPIRQDGPQPSDPDPYPPTSYALFAPLGALPLWGVGLVWYLLNLACSYGIWRLACGLLDLPPQGDRALWLASLGVFPFWVGNLLAGQNGPLLIWLTLAAFTLARAGRSVWSGALIALATSIKVIPALFLLPFLLRRDAKALAGFAGTLLFLVVIVGSLFFGPETNREFHTRWFLSAVHGPADALPDPTLPNTMRSSTRSNNQSFEAVLARLLCPIPGDKPSRPWRVNLVSLDAPAWRRARTIATSLVLVICCWALLSLQRQPPRATEPRFNPFAAELALMSPVLLLVSPIVWSHYYYWMFFPLAYLLHAPQPHRFGAHAVFIIWIAATLLIGFPPARAIGVNLWATVLLGTWLAVHLPTQPKPNKHALR